MGPRRSPYLPSPLSQPCCYMMDLPKHYNCIAGHHTYISTSFLSLLENQTFVPRLIFICTEYFCPRYKCPHLYRLEPPPGTNVPSQGCVEASSSRYKYLTFVPGGDSTRYKCAGLTFMSDEATTWYKCSDICTG
jgi:hypothetical protein